MAVGTGAGGVALNPWHERARRAIFGWLAPAVLHETNNVLTVMAGVRQLLKAGQSLSDRIGTMIDQQLERMEELVGWIRRIGPDDAFESEGPRTLARLFDTLDNVLQLGGKGRGLKVERRVEGPDVPPADGEALLLTILCLFLPALPPRGTSAGTHASLVGKVDGDFVVVEFMLEPAAADPGDEPEALLVRELVAASAGRIEWSGANGRVEGKLHVPRRSAETRQ